MTRSNWIGLYRTWLYFLLVAASPVFATDWFPVATMADGKPFDYRPLSAVSKEWRICALLPHGMDRFWWGVSWGISEEARRLHVKLGIYQAGGYENVPVQRSQLKSCIAQNADAILLAAVSPAALNPEVAEALSHHIVVIGMINGVKSVNGTANVDSDTEQLSAIAAQYIRDDAGKKSIAVGWFPGPKGMLWVQDAENGMQKVLGPTRTKLIPGGYGMPEIGAQMDLVRALFAKTTPDYVLANAPAAEATVRFLHQQHGMKTKVVSYYATEPIVEMIRNGTMLAAPSNSPVIQARIAFDLALRALERKPFPRVVLVSPEMIDAKTVGQFRTEKLFAPDGQWMVQQKLPD